MYHNLTDTEALEAMDEWYQLHLIPGAAHCGSNSLQPGHYPQDNMATIIDWVENRIKPSRLKAAVSLGDYAGEVQQLCQWPQRPLWAGNRSAFECADDEKSVESWTYTMDAFKLQPVW
ncbi:hypothetical protein E8E11_001828 [Didymella keratinophila]|nr:hypothetical protein E8E11_001828 [Didymella keratinophila]